MLTQKTIDAFFKVLHYIIDFIKIIEKVRDISDSFLN